MAVHLYCHSNPLLKKKSFLAVIPRKLMCALLISSRPARVDTSLALPRLLHISEDSVADSVCLKL